MCAESIQLLCSDDHRLDVFGLRRRGRRVVRHQKETDRVVAEATMIAAESDEEDEDEDEEFRRDLLWD